MKKSFTRRVAAAVGVAGVAVMGLTSMGAGGAAAGPLPGGKITKVLVDGTPVTIELTGERVDIQRSVNLSPLSREAFGSGKVKVTVGGQAKGGTIKVGYDLGCQVNFGGSAGINNGDDDASIGASVAPSANGVTVTPKATVPAPNASATLGPGGVTTVWLIDNMGVTSSGITNKEDKNYSVSDYSFSGNTGGLVFSQEHFGLNGCAGYAAGRTRVQVTVSTDSVKGIVNFTGKQFSIG